MHGDLGVAAAGKIHFSIEAFAGCLPDVIEILFLVAGVDAEKHVAVRKAMNKDVVHRAAMFIEERRVMGLPGFELAGVVGGNVVDEIECLRAADFDFAHVTDVEEADGCADGRVFLNDAGVLDGHVPTAKIDHFGFAGEVSFEERGAEQVGGFGHGRRESKFQGNIGRGWGILGARPGNMLKTSIVILVLLMPAKITAAADKKWELAWHDEFSGPANTAPDGRKWTHDLGGDGWGNHELEEYTNRTANAFLDGHGHLAIRAIRTGPNQYMSARLKTEGRFAVKYGKIEARIKIPPGQSLWPAFWMLGDTVSTEGWPACGEIDVMENIGKEPGTVYGTVHGPGYSGDRAIANRTKDSHRSALSERFHVYGVEWSPKRIVFLLDGRRYATVTRENLPNGAKWVFDHPFFLLLNLAVGGNWPGNPHASTRFPQTMLVDWVRVWR